MEEYNTENFSHHGRCSDLDLNQAPTEYKCRVLRLDQSVRSYMYVNYYWKESVYCHSVCLPVEIVVFMEMCCL
jgi:hypothetical protein